MKRSTDKSKANPTKSKLSIQRDTVARLSSPELGGQTQHQTGVCEVSKPGDSCAQQANCVSQAQDGGCTKPPTYKP